MGRTSTKLRAPISTTSTSRFTFSDFTNLGFYHNKLMAFTIYYFRQRTSGPAWKGHEIARGPAQDVEHQYQQPGIIQMLKKNILMWLP